MLKYSTFHIVKYFQSHFLLDTTSSLHFSSATAYSLWVLKSLDVNRVENTLVLAYHLYFFCFLGTEATKEL